MTWDDIGAIPDSVGEASDAAIRRVVIGTTIKEQLTTSFFAHLAELANAGWDLHLVCAPGPWPSGEPPVDVTVHEIDMVKTIAPLHDARSLAAWVRLLRRLQPQAVVGGSPKGALLAMVAGCITGVPTRIYLHRGARWETLAGRRRAMTIKAEKLTARCATIVVAVSDSLADLIQREGITSVRPLVLEAGGSKGVDLERFVPRGSREPGAKITLGFVGRLTRDKGLDTALASLARVRQDHPAARLVVCGEVDEADPPSPVVLADIAADPGIEVLGWRPDMPEVMRGFDVLVFPSAREGLPNAVIEAAASGVPTVGWDVTGVRDAICDGISGRVVSVGDTAAFTEAVAEVVARALGGPGWAEDCHQWAWRFDQRALSRAWVSLLDGDYRQPVGEKPRETPTSAELGVVIVTYRSVDTIVECLSSLAHHAPGCHAVVVDNSGEAELLTKTIEAAGLASPTGVSGLASTQVIDSRANLGYSKAINLGVNALPQACRYLLILNPDVVITADPMILVPGLQRADVTAGRLLGDLPNAARATTYGSELVRSVAGVRFRYLRIPPGSGDTWVAQLAGAYLLQSVDYYRAHPMSEEFDLYYEDAAYCDQAREGKGVLLQDVVVGTHIGGASAAQASAVPYVAARVSRVRYLRRRYPRLPTVAVLAPLALERVMRSATRQAEGQRARTAAWAAVLREARHPGTENPLAHDSGSAPGGGPHA